MSKLKKPIEVETTCDTYRLDQIIGEGGAGRVYGGVDGVGKPIALKLLTNVTSDKRRRFKNEIGFLTKNTHPNIVTVLDHGIAKSDAINGPFFVMQRCKCSLGQLMKDKRDGEQSLRLFAQILDGVEAAHLKGVVHRDLKPENVLVAEGDSKLLVADFGIAQFREEELLTAVKTQDGQRLANFIYAAPEQRAVGTAISAATDIYALGLILNELFTGQVPQGTNYELIATGHPGFAFLDRIVETMLRQKPVDRPQNVAAVKRDILKYREEAVTLQRLSQFNNTVVEVDDVDDPLAHVPPVLVDASWEGGELTLTLDRPVNKDWVNGLRNMGSYTSVMHRGPETFSFQGNKAMVAAAEHDAQNIINHFKDWLPRASAAMRHMLEQAAKRAAYEREQGLRRAREEEERKLRVNRALRI